MAYQPQREDLDLSNSCYEIEQNIKQALDWVNTHLPPEKRYSTLDTLKRLRRQATRYKNATLQRPSVAIFGQSQVGKSYLVSNMARKPNQTALEILTPGISVEALKQATRRSSADIFDFIIDGNPPGKGKESTGFVTRFTVQNGASPVGQNPYLVKLFSQVDLVKVITNGYLADLKDYKYKVDSNKISELVQRLMGNRLSEVAPGFTEDDVYDLRDYLNQAFNDHFIVKNLNDIKFWDSIAPLVPYLDAAQRWEIFEVLWGHQMFFTDMFKRLSQGLKQLSFAKEVWCGLEALAPNTETIIDIERVRELFSEFNADKAHQDPDWSKSNPIRVVGNNSISETIDRSIISALAAELVLPLADNTADIPQRAFLKNTDILDFPGARSRKKIEENTFTHEPKIQDKVEVFIRGKVAYLFDIYQQNFGISSLVFCMDDAQPNVEDIQSLIHKWIKSAHGDTAEKREERENKLTLLVPNSGIERLIPLLFVLTKFNNNLTQGASDIIGDPRSHDSKWLSRLNANFSQYMTGAISDKWTTKWNLSDGSFKNAFLLRDPLYPAGVYEGYKEENEYILDNQRDRINDIQQSFLENPHVKRYFRTPLAAWQEAVTPNKNGGIDYIIKYLTPVCNPVIKREQISEAIKQLRLALGKELCTHYEGGDAEQKLKKANMKATQVFMTLSRMQTHFGQFMYALSLQDNVAKDIFKEVVNGLNPQMTSTPSGGNSATTMTQIRDIIEQTFGLKDVASKNIEDILKELAEECGIDKPTLANILQEEGIDLDALFKKEIQVQRTSDIYAEKLLSYWIHNLNQIKTHPRLALWTLKEDRVDMIIEELKKNMDRVKLKKHIADAVNPYVENFNISENDYIISYIATLKVNEFVNTLGWRFVEEAEKTTAQIKVNKNDTLPIFVDRPVPKTDVNALRVATKGYPGETMRNQWVAGMRHSFSYNVLKETNMANTELILAMGQLGDIIKKMGHECT